MHECAAVHSWSPFGDGSPCAPSSDAVYGLGLIGASVYYFSQAASLLDSLLAFFQGLVWPAFVIYDLLKYFHAS